MNVFLQHKFELAKNNFNYCFCVPAGASFADAKEVIEAFKVHLDAMEKQLAKADEARKQESEVKENK